jgi:hypothetical protein
MPRDPGGHEIPVEWSVVRVEKHGRKFLNVEYHYLCPDCTVTFQCLQTSLKLKNPTNQQVTPP